MNLSLREQLLKAGLVTEKQAKQAERTTSDQRHRQAKGGKRSPPPPPEPTKAAQQTQAAKLLRDQELNRKQQEKAARKARAAELHQLVVQLRVPRPESDDYFNFVDGGKVHRIQVTPELRARLVAGTVAIVRYDGRGIGLSSPWPGEFTEDTRQLDLDAVLDDILSALRSTIDCHRWSPLRRHLDPIGCRR